MNCIRTLWYFSLITPYGCLGKRNMMRSQINNFYGFNTFNEWIGPATTFSTRGVQGPPWRILFMGSDDFSMKHLERLYSKYKTRTLISHLAVSTSPGSLVAQFARFENLHFYKWPLQVEDIEDKFDFGIVVSFGHLIPKNIIDAMPLGILNVHGSLLPRWRGAAPIQYAIMNGDNETGVTVMKIDPYRSASLINVVVATAGFDTGNIVCQYKCTIYKNETALELRSRLAKHGSELLMDCIRDLLRYLQNARPQPIEGVSYAPRVTSETAQIDWGTMTAQDICNLQRAVGHLYPVHTRFQGHVVRFYSICVVIPKNVTNNTDFVVRTKYKREPKNTNELFMNSEEIDNPTTGWSEGVIKTTHQPRKPLPGKIYYCKYSKGLYVQCYGGGCLVVHRLCVVGKKQCLASDFYNGYMSHVEYKDWTFY